MSEIVERAEALLAAGALEDCIALLEPAIRSGDASTEMHRIHAEALYGLKRYEDSLPSFQICIKDWGIEGCPWRVFLRAQTALNKSSLRREARGKYWRECTDPVSLVFDRSLKALAGGAYGEAEKLFRAGCRDIFENEEVVRIWMESLSFIRAGLEGREAAYDYRPRSTKKIIVSGLGWSGSGALYDFFSEFDNVRPIKGEARILESGTGIKALVNARRDPEKFDDAVLEFFFQNLLGRGELRNSRSFDIFLKTRRTMSKRKPMDYALGVQCIAYLLGRTLAEIRRSGEASHSSLVALADETANRIIIGDVGGDYALLDNVIHIANVQLVAYLRDVYIFCTFRDQRSNFVSRLREDAGFALSAQEFIEQRARMMPSLTERLEQTRSQTAGLAGVRIFKVFFEEFVLSEAFRHDLAKEIGLDLAAHGKHKRFRPWESARNVMLHQEHERPEDIAAIAEALAEYCVEPALVPMTRPAPAA